MRGVAAIVVMVYHYFIFSDSYPRFLKNPFLAVDFFFILSGFVICHAYSDKLSQGMSVRDYVARRIGRLYPMMAVSLILGAPLFYLRAVSPESDYTPRHFVATLAQNLAMLPYLTGKKGEIDIPLFPSSLPLWSISFEMLASLSFPFLLRLSEKRLRTFCLASLLILFVSAFLRGFATHKRLFDMDGGWGVENFFGGFPRVFFGFSCGMLLYRRHREATPENTPTKITVSPWLLYTALVGILIFPSYVQGVYPLFVVALLAPVLVWLGSFSPCRAPVTLAISEFLGWISYPLYCLHMPAFDAVRFLYTKNGLNHFVVPQQVPAIAVALILSIIVGLAIDRLQLQRRLTDLLNRAFAFVA